MRGYSIDPDRSTSGRLPIYFYVQVRRPQGDNLDVFGLYFGESLTKS